MAPALALAVAPALALALPLALVQQAGHAWGRQAEQLAEKRAGVARGE